MSAKPFRPIPSLGLNGHISKNKNKLFMSTDISFLKRENSFHFTTFQIFFFKCFLTRNVVIFHVKEIQDNDYYDEGRLMMMIKRG